MHIIITELNMIWRPKIQDLDIVACAWGYSNLFEMLIH